MVNSLSLINHLLLSIAPNVLSFPTTTVAPIINNLTTSFVNTSHSIFLMNQSVTHSNSTISDLIITTEYSFVINSTIGNHKMESISGNERHVLFTQLLMGLLTAAFVCALIILGFIFIRKKKLDKLRLHLMPVYNFDPSEDGEDWETELLEEPFVTQYSLSDGAHKNLGSIKLDTGLTGGLNIKNGSFKTSLNASSGLLANNSTNIQASRHFYTNEMPVA